VAQLHAAQLDVQTLDELAEVIVFRVKLGGRRHIYMAMFLAVDY